jgi:transposase
LRQLTRARKDLVAHRVAVANQLRAHLQISFPGAVGLFHDIDSGITLRLLERLPTTERAAWLSPKRWTAWPTSVGYSGRTPAPTVHQRLTNAPAGATGAAAETAAAVTEAFVATLRAITTQINALAARIAEQLQLHTDHNIFTSLPRSGIVRAARLLAESATPAAGSPPPTSWPAWPGSPPPPANPARSPRSAPAGADKQLRDAICDFAGDSRQANPWAADLYHRARHRPGRHRHTSPGRHRATSPRR